MQCILVDRLAEWTQECVDAPASNRFEDSLAIG